MPRYVGQPHSRIVVGECVERVVVVHPPVARVPLQDHLLERLQTERSIDPALADWIANRLEIPLAHEVPHWNVVGVGYREPVVRVGCIAACDREQATLGQQRALVRCTLDALRRDDGRGHEQADHRQDQRPTHAPRPSHDLGSGAWSMIWTL